MTEDHGAGQLPTVWARGRKQIRVAEEQAAKRIRRSELNEMKSVLY